MDLIGGDDDFFGAECEMDDQMLIVADDEETDESEEVSRIVGDQAYERKFSEKEAEFCEPEPHFEKKLRVSRSRRNNDDGPIYPPERKPPIFDFFTVLTAFIAAVILAYYTISSY